jgi:hypothetical protein
MKPPRAACAAALAAWLSLGMLGGCATPGGAGAATTDTAAAMRDDSDRYIVLAVDNPLAAPGGRAGSSLGGYGPSPRYLLGGRAAATLAALAREHGLKEAAGWPIVALGWHCVVFELPSGRSRTELLATLAADPRVRLAQPLQDFDTHAATGRSAASAASVAASAASATEHVPYNDPYVNLQRGFVDTGAALAHRFSTGAGVRVAVVDTGAALNHPDLLGRVVATRDLVGEPAGRFESDRHGTEVAGVIAAVGNNREGIVGIAPQAGLEIFKACWARQANAAPAAPPPGAAAPRPDTSARCNSFTLAKALASVLESDARIVNLSLGGPSDPLLDKLLAELLRQGRVVVGALPPDGRRGGFPTGTAGVLAAGVAGELAPAMADVVAAPGRDVLTLQPGTGYDYASGSSIAAAHVSGVAALLLSADPRLDRSALCALIHGASAASPLNASAALEALRSRQAPAKRML